jgi:hypothetical protein
MRTTRNIVARVREMNRGRTDPAIKRLPENQSSALEERLVNVVNVEFVVLGMSGGDAVFRTEHIHEAFLSYRSES